MAENLDFEKIAAAALAGAPALLARWLPGGRWCGREYTVRNPKRADQRAGSFRINSRTGKWGDFATSDRGGDLISLAAFLFDLSQLEAARKVAGACGIEVRNGR